MISQIYRDRILARIAWIQLNQPANVVRVVLWQVVHVALNKKGYFETNVFEIQLHARIVVVLDVRDRYKWIIMHNHRLERGDAISY